MKILAIHIGQPVSVLHGRGVVQTSIFKWAVNNAVEVDCEGIIGDQQSDLRVHGGKDKAVYVYPIEHYQWYESNEGIPATAGLFGENLTVSGGLTDDRVFVGDQYQIGDEVILEVSCQREPCYKLGIRLGDPRFVEKYRNVGRVGFYTRVIQEGSIQVGDEIRLLHRPNQTVSVQRLHEAFVGAIGDREIIENILETPELAERMREQIRLRTGR